MLNQVTPSIDLLRRRVMSARSWPTGLLQGLLLVLLIAGLSACGFHLRGAVAIPADYSPLYIKQNKVFEVANDLKGLLRGNHIEVVEQATAAKAEIVLISQLNRNRILSVDSNGRAREYLLVYTLNYSLQAEGLKPLNDKIELNRSLLFDANTVLAVNEEGKTLYRDMQRDAARLLLLKFKAYLKHGQSDTSQGQVE